MKNTINLMIFIGAVAVQALVAQQATLHPTTFTAQGVLRDADGRTLADDDYEMTFQIYGNENGTGTALWSETADVEVINGVWAYTIGSNSGNPLDDLDDDGTNYLKITVGTDVLTPLVQISLTPFETLNVSAGGNLISASGNVGIGTTSPSEKLDVDGNIELNGSLKMTPGSAGANLADTFSGNTVKSEISFAAGGSSNDPGKIIHETRASGGEANEGVLHLMPSDDNQDGDYVSIHGTNDADQIKLHTSGKIEGVTNMSMTGRLTINRGSDLFLKAYRPNQGWNYMGWYEGGNREAWMGMNNTGNWQLNKENGGEIFFTGADVNIYEDLDVGGDLNVDQVNVDGYVKGGPGSVVRKAYYEKITTHSNSSGSWTNRYGQTYQKIFPDSHVIIEATMRYTIAGYGGDDWRSRIKSGSNTYSYEHYHYSYNAGGGGQRSGGLNPMYDMNTDNTSSLPIYIQLKRHGGDDALTSYQVNYIITEIRP